MNYKKIFTDFRFLLFALLPLTLFFSSCDKQNTHSENSADSLVYTIQKYEKHSPTCVKEDSLCATVRFEYPVFKEKDLAPINEQIMQQLIYIFHDEEDKSAQSPKSFDDLAKKFTQDYEELVKSSRAEALQSKETLTAMPWNMEGYAKVLRQTPELVVIHTNSYWFTGGAHPVSMEYYHNYDLKTKKKLSLDDICEKDYSPKLLAIAEKLFRKQEHLADTVKLDDEHGYFFENGKFLLNDNFMLTNKGLTFLWNVYEIKSYAEGVTTLEIPFEGLKGILKGEYL